MKEKTSENLIQPPLHCEVVGRDAQNSKPLTVGEIFKVQCKTESLILNPSQSHFKAPRPYQLELLKIETQPDGRLELKVTSYQVGEYKSQELFLSDGINKVAVEGIEFKVESVIDQKNPPKGPFGPFGGYVLELPAYYFWSLLGILGIFVFLLIFKLIRRWQRRRLIEGLKKHDSRWSPLSQLHLRFRQLEKNQNHSLSEKGLKPQEEIEDILRLFIVREFRVPAYDWSNRAVVQFIQNRFSFLGNDTIKDLMVLLRETGKVKILENPQPKDLEQLIRKIKKWVDSVDRSVGLHHSRGRK